MRSYPTAPRRRTGGARGRAGAAMRSLGGLATAIHINQTRCRCRATLRPRSRRARRPRRPAVAAGPLEPGRDRLPPPGHGRAGASRPGGALAQVEGSIVKDVPEVLFVCVHNAGRSQMAAALLDHHARGMVHVRSAGSDPADQLNPAVVAAMAEWEIDLSKEFPKPLTDEVVQAADAVITMGCGDACPIYPGKRYLDWELDDPAGKPVEQVRAIRDDIDQRVQALLAELVGDRPTGRQPA